MSENNSANPTLGTDSATDDPSITGATIILEEVTKDYGGAQPAVDHLTLEIPAGQTVMFVGPSGCGKTTTLKMINRLIEPTSGRIVINGDDVTQMNGDKLRRHIGYVIQAGGLLPHMTVAENIAIVPKLLGWDKKRISERVDELLDLVSLEPSEYRSRYPKELSGGQQQRVGVARALAADPPVLLMDEPFGAVDPITRQRLQDELIHIQSELHKTVVFVTHDFDEAIKLGDWIVIFNVGGQIMQYDTPDQILANPANEFVEDFIGRGSAPARPREGQRGSAQGSRSRPPRRRHTRGREADQGRQSAPRGGSRSQRTPGGMGHAQAAFAHRPGEDQVLRRISAGGRQLVTRRRP